MTPPAWLVVGRIRRAHGIRGEVVVAALTDAPDAVFAPGARVFVGDAQGSPVPGPDADPLALTVEHATPFQDAWRVAFAELRDRTAAEQWAGRTLVARVSDLPAPAADEVWRHELVGLRVVDPRGAALGEVAEWYEVPQGLLLDVRDPAGRSVTVPYTEAFVVKVDRAARVLTLDPPAGLFDADPAPGTAP